MSRRLLLTYDIPDDGKRRRLARILEDFGERIQWSVFEFLVSPAEETEMRERLREEGFFEDDEVHIVVYHLHDGLYEQTERYGRAQVWEEAGFIV